MMQNKLQLATKMLPNATFQTGVRQQVDVMKHPHYQVSYCTEGAQYWQSFVIYDVFFILLDNRRQNQAKVLLAGGGKLRPIKFGYINCLLHTIWIRQPTYHQNL